MAMMAMSSCNFVPGSSLLAFAGQQQNPVGFHHMPGDDWSGTTGVNVDGSDVKMLCTRVEGESKGLKILGIFPVVSPSEHDAIKGMYKHAQARGASLEGESRHFINKSIERSSKYYILWSNPKITATGDLVQIMTPRVRN